eukprot:gnl/Spiro4/1654_TR869_c0_g1_i1.p1 gnl/Spiro4/1654_TR869_c0_g1~~gnl/Spiro4/1654_TR869_c0_g1_i1.p1  ORF type:complete len:165 (-),score=34.46 gnl/Spiro4/1654_TR869_c0_g1_i1:34-528(-)
MASPVRYNWLGFPILAPKEPIPQHLLHDAHTPPPLSSLRIDIPTPPATTINKHDAPGEGGGYRVVGAGHAEINGLYLPIPELNDGVRQWRKGEYTLLRYRFPQSRNAYWFLSRRGAAVDQDVDYYRTAAPTTSDSPPRDDWVGAEVARRPLVRGAAPAPNVFAA